MQNKNSMQSTCPLRQTFTHSTRPKTLSLPRYSGNGTQQMGLLVESASLFDNGNWTVTMRNNGSTAIADGIAAQVNSQNASMLGHLSSHKFLHIAFSGVQFFLRHSG